MRTRLHVLPPVLAFLLAALLQGLVFIGSFGPLSMPDPDMHASSAWSLASGQSFTRVETGVDAAGNPHKRQTLRLPSWMDDHEIMENGTVSSLLADGPHDRSGKYADQWKTLSRHARLEPMSARSTQYSPLAYLPQATGIKLGMLTGADDWTCLTLGRVANLTAYLLLAGIAILILPCARWPMVLLAASPVGVFLAATLSADAPTLGICMLFACLTGRACARGKASWALTGGMAFCLLLLPSLKVAYLPLAFLPLAAPKGSFRRPQWLLSAGSGLVGCLSQGVWMLGWQDTLIRDHASKGSNLAGMLAHPMHALISNLGNMVQIMLTVPFSGVMMPVTLAVLLLLAHAVGNGIPVRTVIWTGVPILASLTLVLLVLQLTWTLHAGQVEPVPGFQERYLLPLACALVVPACTVRRDTVG